MRRLSARGGRKQSARAKLRKEIPDGGKPCAVRAKSRAAYLRYDCQNLVAAILRRPPAYFELRFVRHRRLQTADVGGISIGSAGTSVFTDTCGQLSPLKFNVTFCVY